MSVTESQVKKILMQPPKFNQLGFSMLIKRLSCLYLKNPSSVVLQQSTKEINAYLIKYGAIMSADFEKISQM